MMAARNSQTWIQASLDLPGPGVKFGMCGCDRWHYYCTQTCGLVGTTRHVRLGLTVLALLRARR